VKICVKSKTTIVERTDTLFSLTLFFCLHLTLSFAQVQVGSDINTTEAYDFFGGTLALSDDGGRLIVGALANTANGLDAGLARAYEWIDGEWVQMGADFFGAASGHELGASVAISANGSRIAIGAPGRLGETGFAGQVQVFEWRGSNWMQLGPDLEGEVNGELFGSAVSLSSDGSLLAIGTPLNSDGFSSAGQVKVFQWTGTSWMQKGTDINGLADDLLGNAVSLSADGLRLAVDAIGNEENGSKAGQVRVYEWVDEDWSKVGADIDGEVGAFLGCSLSLSADGSRLAIGARGAVFDGKVKVYEWVNGFWVPMGEDFSGSMGDNVGCAVSLSADGTRLAVGALGKDDNGPESGQVKVYEWLNNEWIQVGADINGKENSALGEAVALSADGSRLAVGATFSTLFGSGLGLVRVFDLSPVSSVLAENIPSWAIYPNPTNGLVYFEGFIPESLTVIDLFGKLVFHSENIDQWISIDHLSEGIYVMRAEADGYSKSFKIVKQ
jgi:hypothetical protein